MGRNFIAIILLLLLAGCGGEDADGRVPVQVVTWKPNNAAAWDTAISRFEKTHPGIRVELEIGPNDSTALYTLLTQKLRNRDTSVDAFLMDVVWTAEFAGRFAIPFDDRFPPGEREAFFSSTIDADTIDGRIYAVPFNTDSGLLYYRKDLLEEAGLAPPRTWPELVEQAKRVVGEHPQDDLVGYTGQFMRYEGLVCNALEFVRSNGGRLDRPDSPAAVRAVEFIRDEIIGNVAPEGALTWQEQEALDVFASGGAVFMRNWPYAWAILQEGDLAGRVGIAPLPAFPGGAPAAALGGWRFGISPFSEHPDEAWAFVEFMTSEEMQRHFAIESGKAPARKALYNDPEVLRANPHFAELGTVFRTAAPRPKSPIYARISNILQRYLHRAISSDDSDVEALAREAGAEIEKARARIR